MAAQRDNAASYNPDAPAMLSKYSAVVVDLSESKLARMPGINSSMMNLLRVSSYTSLYKSFMTLILSRRKQQTNFIVTTRERRERWMMDVQSLILRMKITTCVVVVLTIVLVVGQDLPPESLTKLTLRLSRR